MVLERDLQSIFFCLDIFVFINSQGIVNALVTPTGFFVKFQGASALPFPRTVPSDAFVSLLGALLTVRELPLGGS